MQDKMVTILHSYYLDDGTTSSYPISNAWNYLFLTVNWIVSFWVDRTVHSVRDILGTNLHVVHIYPCFSKLGCCGVNPVLSTTNDFDGTSWCTTSGSCQATVSQIPKTCCLNINKNNYTSAPSACHASVNSGTYNTEVVQFLSEKTSYIWIKNISF